MPVCCERSSDVYFLFWLVIHHHAVPGRCDGRASRVMLNAFLVQLLAKRFLNLGAW